MSKAKRARQKEGRQARIEAAKKAAERRRKRNLNIFLGAVVLLIAAILVITRFTGHSKKVNTTTPPAATATATTPVPSATPTASPTPASTSTPGATSSPNLSLPPQATAAPAGVPSGDQPCTTTQPPRGATVNQSTPPPMTIDPSKNYFATINTSCGQILVNLDVKDSPNTVNSFVYLANKGFYNGLTFHRVAKNFAVQGGDPSGNGSGGPGYSVQDKVPAGVTYSLGTVAMAKTGAEPAGTSGSQFFIVPADSAAGNFTPDYAVLGHVTVGTVAVQKMNALAPASGDGPPTQPIYIYTIVISTT